MGTLYSNSVWEMSPIPGMSSSAWLVFHYLAYCANNQTGKCWPSMTTIAKKTKIGVKQARRLVHKLEQLQLIEIVGNRNGGRPGSTLQFRLLVEPRVNQKTPPDDGRPPPQPTPLTPPLQRESTPVQKYQYGSPRVTATAPAHGSQTIMNRKNNQNDKLLMSSLFSDKSQTEWIFDDWVRCGRSKGIDFDPEKYPNVYDYVERIKELLISEDCSPPPTAPYNLTHSKES